jgi:hypothetical protein
MRLRPSEKARRETMLDLALIAALALFCVYLAYERLTHRL